MIGFVLRESLFDHAILDQSIIIIDRPIFYISFTLFSSSSLHETFKDTNISAACIRWNLLWKSKYLFYETFFFVISSVCSDQMTNDWSSK